MKKTMVVACLLVMTGCASNQVQRDHHLDMCVRSSVVYAMQGYASNGQEMKILINTCEGNGDWQKTKHGQEIMAVLDKNN